MGEEDLIKAELEKLRAENEALKEIVKLRAENDELKQAASKGLTMKVSEKGALSVYGLGRFPVTLYKEQWIRLLSFSDDIRAFIKSNEEQLKAKA
jgi:hypothetical protein